MSWRFRSSVRLEGGFRAFELEGRDVVNGASLLERRCRGRCCVVVRFIEFSEDMMKKRSRVGRDEMQMLDGQGHVNEVPDTE